MLQGIRFRRQGITLAELLVCVAIIVILAACLIGGGHSLPPAPAGATLPTNFEVIQQPGFVTSLDVSAAGVRYGSVTRQGSVWTVFHYEDTNGVVKAKGWITREGWGKKVEVKDGADNAIGSLKKEYWQSGFGSTVYTVYDGSGREIAKSEKEDWFATSITLKDGRGRAIARLDRPTRAFGDSWTVTVLVPNVVDHRVLIMIAAFKTNADK
ncbi:MAG: prepilin-type N-terminal cleavage/methylation domain-containing protein [Candidatus Obscuribacterales bacterium]|nr:prepilin-type N-terminal cleavage/methylation domain-containing protein [Candidatus Obscuribacterales bacterium]